jgi:hypothetical protein
MDAHKPRFLCKTSAALSYQFKKRIPTGIMLLNSARLTQAMAWLVLEMELPAPGEGAGPNKSIPISGLITRKLVIRDLASVASRHRL